MVMEDNTQLKLDMQKNYNLGKLLYSRESLEQIQINA